MRTVKRGTVINSIYTNYQFVFHTYRVVLAVVSGCLTAAYWMCGHRRQQDLDLEGEFVRNPGVEEERDEALFNFPPGGNNNEPPPLM